MVKFLIQESLHHIAEEFNGVNCSESSFITPHFATVSLFAILAMWKLLRGGVYISLARILLSSDAFQITTVFCPEHKVIVQTHTLDLNKVITS